MVVKWNLQNFLCVNNHCSDSEHCLNEKCELCVHHGGCQVEQFFFFSVYSDLDIGLSCSVFL